MLSNAALAGFLASAYLTVLVLHLNPGFPLTLAAVGPLVLVMAAAYGLNLAALFYGSIVIRQLMTNDGLSPGWLSVRLLSWLDTEVSDGDTLLILPAMAGGAQEGPPRSRPLWSAAGPRGAS